MEEQLEKNKGRGVGNISLLDNCTPMEEFIVRLKFDADDTCLMLLKSGKMIVDESLLSLCYMN